MNAFVYGLVVALHVIICLILVVVVLLQEGKGDGGLGGAFGGGSQTVFGSRGPANFFHYLTTGSAVLFIFTSLFLSCTPSPGNKTTSVIDEATPVASATPMMSTTAAGMAPMGGTPMESLAPSASPAASTAKAVTSPSKPATSPAKPAASPAMSAPKAAASPAASPK